MKYGRNQDVRNEVVRRLRTDEAGVRTAQYKLHVDWHHLWWERLRLREEGEGGFQSVPTILFPDGSELVEPSSAELEKKIGEME